MKILFHFPTFNKNPAISQNRQFQWMPNNNRIYPYLRAMEATYLMQKGYDIYWDEPLSYIYDKIIIEAKYPVYTKISELQKEYSQIEIIGDCVNKKWSELINEHFSNLPYPDRILTKWQNYQENGNFRYKPNTYIMSSLDCLYHKCSFCSWANLYHDYEDRGFLNICNELIYLRTLGVKEIMDDSGTMSTHYLNNDIWKDFDFVKNCNVRFDSNFDPIYLKKWKFRMLLWGLESINQITLDRLNKGIKVGQIELKLKECAKAGLENHLAVMFGYPWETYDMAMNTVNFVRKMLIKGYAKTAQATICIPYPNTPLWQECKDDKLLLSENWEDYDMSKPVMESPIPINKLMKLPHKIYITGLHPLYILRNIRDFKYLSKGIKWILKK